MKTATIREFRDQATKLFRKGEPVIITRRGEIIGFFVPADPDSLPLEIRQDLFRALAAEVRQAMRERRVKEAEVLADFEEARTAGRRR